MKVKNGNSEICKIMSRNLPMDTLRNVVSCISILEYANVIVGNPTVMWLQDAENYIRELKMEKWRESSDTKAGNVLRGP
jgi:hypothetical protein